MDFYLSFIGIAKDNERFRPRFVSSFDVIKAPNLPCQKTSITLAKRVTTPFIMRERLSVVSP